MKNYLLEIKARYHRKLYLYPYSVCYDSKVVISINDITADMVITVLGPWDAMRGGWPTEGFEVEVADPNMVDKVLECCMAIMPENMKKKKT